MARKSGEGTGKGGDPEPGLWQRAMRDVKPLRRAKKAGPGATPARTPKKKEKTGGVTAVFPLPVPGLKKPALSPGTDRNTSRKLRRGKMEIEGTLDLHGMNRTEARIALEKYLVRAHGQGKRCVLVITGKGGRGRGDDADGDRYSFSKKAGVLKESVPAWLREDPLRALVIETVAARPGHGGEGALYILLRRRRD